ncbi:hypothetical protein Tco_0238278 [Tanacetum coccineum]
MTGNKSFLTDYQEIDSGFIAFGESPKGGKITGKGKIRTGKLDFEDVYFVKELKFNRFSVSQMCDKKNSVLFTKTECLVLSPDFKLLDESQALACKVLDSTTCTVLMLKNVVPSVVLTWSGPDWLFDIDLLTNSISYEPVIVGNETNKNASIEDNVDAVPSQQYILQPLLYDSLQSLNDEVADDAEIERFPGQGEDTNNDSTNRVNTVSSSVNVISSSFTTVDPGRERAQRNEMFTSVNAAGSYYDNLGGSILVNAATFPNDDFPTDPLMPDLEDTADLQVTGIFSGAYDDEDVGT